MNKIEFLSRLNRALEHLPQQEREDILNDYEEHFRISAEMGKTEEETAEGLGSPEELGATYVEGEPLECPQDIDLPPSPSSPYQTSPCSGTSPSQENYQEKNRDSWHHTPEQNAWQAPAQGEPATHTTENGTVSGSNVSQEVSDSQGTFHWDQEGAAAFQQVPSYRVEVSPPSTGKQIFSTVMILLLTIFFVIPIGISLAISFWFVIFSLVLCAIAVAAAFFLFHFIHIGLVLLGAASLCLGVASLLALILYTSWIIKLFSSYFHWCGRVISGRKEQVS